MSIDDYATRDYVVSTVRRLYCMEDALNHGLATTNLVCSQHALNCANECIRISDFSRQLRPPLVQWRVNSRPLPYEDDTCRPRASIGSRRTRIDCSPRDHRTPREKACCVRHTSFAAPVATSGHKTRSADQRCRNGSIVRQRHSHALLAYCRYRSCALGRFLPQQGFPLHYLKYEILEERFTFRRMRMTEYRVDECEPEPLATCGS